MTEKYIATLDLGTTNVRCHIVDVQAKTIGYAMTKINVLHPKPGYVEIDPDELWSCIVQIMKEAIENAKLTAKDITCLGITTLRSTFVTWKKDTGKHLHNFITWKDMRAKDIIKNINESFSIKVIQRSAGLVHFFTHSERMSTASQIKLSGTHCTGRLVWILQNTPDIVKEIKNENLYFGTIDTWLIYKLTNGRQHISEISQASSTGLYDPFELNWSGVVTTVTNIPKNIFPKVVNSDYDFGCTSKEIFGASIPIKCVMADQQAAMYGAGCINRNDMKITMGTGSFINCNTGEKPVAGNESCYPLVAWKIHDKLTYICEAACKDTGPVLKWAVNIEVANDVSKMSDQAYNVKNTDGAFFIPAFSGLSPPQADESAASGFIGVKETTTRDHLVRAILESIAFTIYLAYEVVDTNTSDGGIKEIRVDGGVSQCDFICQMLADMTHAKIVRFDSHEQTMLGATFMAGLNAGIWKQEKELEKFRTINKVFTPNREISDIHFKKMQKWQRATKRFTNWY